MLELDDKLAGGAAAKAEAAAAEGAAKAKEEALAKAREAACSHECTHLKGTDSLSQHPWPSPNAGSGSESLRRFQFEGATSEHTTHTCVVPRATWCTPVFWSCARVVCGGLAHRTGGRDITRVLSRVCFVLR